MVECLDIGRQDASLLRAPDTIEPCEGHRRRRRRHRLRRRARACRRAAQSVRVIDMRGTGLGRTQASAGILAPRIEGHIDALLRLGVNSLALYDAFIARVSDDAQLAIECERSGSLHVAKNEAAAMELAIAARRFAHAGIAHELMPGHEARRLEAASVAAHHVGTAAADAWLCRASS